MKLYFSNHLEMEFILHQNEKRIVLETDHCPDHLTLTYVPMHLHYMLFEVLKNACRASTERCDAHNLDLQARPVKIVIADGREDITIKVSDEGGGIPRSEIDDVWTYLHSTAPSPGRAFHGDHGWQLGDLGEFGKKTNDPIFHSS